MAQLKPGDKVKVDLDLNPRWADEKLCLNGHIVTIDTFAGFFDKKHDCVNSVDDGNHLECYRIIEDKGMFAYTLNDFNMLARNIDNFL